MTSIRKDIIIEAPAAEVWGAVRDVGAAHERLARGFVTATVLDGDARIVTFANGAVARELIVDVDDDRRRFAYAVVESPLGMAHHHATMEVVTEGRNRTRLVWITDTAPDSVAGAIGEMIETGAVAMARTLGWTDMRDAGVRSPV